jgi:hypothetical protein
MSKPINKWDEDDILQLPLGENDNFERKGSELLDLTLQSVTPDKVLNELGKQLSAFADSGGGRIFYGVRDDGTVDRGGVTRIIRGRQNAKDWLESVIPAVVAYEILGVNVYEVLPKATGSVIAKDKALYIVDIPDSERAPHQSVRDNKYYIRLGGRSQPASHQLIEDIRSRRKHPTVDVTSVDLQVLSLPITTQNSIYGMGVVISGPAKVKIQVKVRNAIGSPMATHTCLQLEPFLGSSWGNYDNQISARRGDYWEFLAPIYPGMEITLTLNSSILCKCERYAIEGPHGTSRSRWTFQGKPASEIKLSWTLFADSAPARTGIIKLEDLGFGRQAALYIESLSGEDRFPITHEFPDILKALG